MAFKYRADQVGSLLRPKNLLEANRSGVATDKLKALEDQEILRVLGRQKDLGFKIFTDGEFRRRGFMSDFHDSVSGLDMEGAIDRNWQSSGGGAAVATPTSRPVAGIVVDKIKKTKRMTSHEVDFLKLHSPGDIKITLPSANQFPAISYRKGITDKIYSTHFALLWDIVPIIKSEIQALLQDGVKYIQIDAPRYSYFIDPKWRQYVQDEMGVNPDDALSEAIKADNACLEGARRDGVVLAIHLCRGNNRSQWYAQGGYDPIAEKVFSQLDVDAFLLEYESERAGTFEPLRFVPRNKTVVLGLVSSKLPQMEPQDQVVRRIEEATKYVPLENLALSPQCGFASTMEGNLLTEEEQWSKLGLVAKTARQVWKDY
ncbi:MAG: methionine synthase [Acidobacteriia bacterium]|nr:methionine synthase [Terriglobia bacterium]